MKQYICHITLMILSLFTVNIIWGQTLINGTWGGGALTGSFKLNGNTTLTGTISVSSGTLTIDLNGHTLDRKGTKAADFLFTVGESRTLNIIDSSTGKTGKIKGGKGDRGGCALISGILNFKGGEVIECISTDGNYGDTPDNNTVAANMHYVTQGCGGAFFVNSGGTLNMFDGAKITNCKTEKLDGSHGRGGAVWVAGTFNMSGGTISGCEASWGGAVFVFHGARNPYYNNDTRSGTFNMTGGTITGCKSYSDGCGVFTESKVEISGTAKITSNRPLRWVELQLIDGKYPNVQLNGGHGGAIYATGDKAVVNMSGGELSNNMAESGGAVMLWTGSTMTMTGGKMHANYAMGKPSLGNGGALYLQGSTFNFKGGTLSNNVANRYGGAINTNSGATLNIEGNCIIKDNRASHGGGISQEAGECSLTLDGTGIEIIQNEAHGHQVNISDAGATSVTNNVLGNGGGVFIEKGTVSMKGAKIKNNKASGHGGGASVYVKRIHGRKTSVIIEGGEISNNEAQYGGGIDVYADFQSLKDESDKNDPFTGKSELTVNFLAGTLSENKASANGAGIYVGFNETYSTATMTIGTNSTTPTIQNNKAEGNGGGLGMSNNGVFVVQNATMSNNTARNGGAIWLGAGSFTINNGTFTSNTANENGGGIYVGGGTFTVKKNVSMNGNIATTQAGGGIYLGSGQFTVESNGTINLGVDGSGNSAGTNGGGIYCNAPLTVEGNTYIQNGSAQQGGGLYVQGTAKFAKITKFVNNHSALDGGAVYVHNGDIEIQGTNLTLANNHSLKNGGAFFVNGGGIDASTCSEATISNNYSTEDGGAFYVAGGNIQLCKSNLIGNGKDGSRVSTRNGGAIALKNGVFEFADGSVIKDNEAKEYGGALYVSNEVQANINCLGGTYDANKAGLGGGIYANGPIILTFAANVRNNTAIKNGGGLYLDGGVNMTFGAAGKDGLIVGNSAGIKENVANDGSQQEMFGVGGGIYLNKGTLSFYTNDKKLGIYGNSATYEAADIFTSGNSTTINLPNVTKFNLTGFDVPGDLLYWVKDFNKQRYEDALLNLDVEIDDMILKFDETEIQKVLTEKQCLDLGYDLVYVVLNPQNMHDNEFAGVTMKYTNASGKEIVYRKAILKSGDSTIVGLPSGNWKFDITPWSEYKYSGQTFSPAHKADGFIYIKRKEFNGIANERNEITITFIQKTTENNSVDVEKLKQHQYLKRNIMRKNSNTNKNL